MCMFVCVPPAEPERGMPHVRSGMWTGTGSLARDPPGLDPPTSWTEAEDYCCTYLLSASSVAACAPPTTAPRGSTYSAATASPPAGAPPGCVERGDGAPPEAAASCSGRVEGGAGDGRARQAPGAAAGGGGGARRGGGGVERPQLLLLPEDSGELPEGSLEASQTAGMFQIQPGLNRCDPDPYPGPTYRSPDPDLNPDPDI